MRGVHLGRQKLRIPRYHATRGYCYLRRALRRRANSGGGRNLAYLLRRRRDPTQYQPQKLALSSHNNLIIPAVSFEGQITVSGARDCGFPIWSTDEGLAPM